MPTYEYRCENCGRYELEQKITENALEVCPKCGGKTQRLISRNGNIIFKGSGFHVTDYRNSGYSQKAGMDKSQEKFDVLKGTEPTPSSSSTDSSK